MAENVIASIEQHFGDMTDPRIDRTKLHKLLDILVIAICAVIAGADNWEDVEEFGKARMEWFRTFLELSNGIPSHDTFTRVFARLVPEQFQACFISWMSDRHTAKFQWRFVPYCGLPQNIYHSQCCRCRKATKKVATRQVQGHNLLV